MTTTENRKSVVWADNVSPQRDAARWASRLALVLGAVLVVSSVIVGVFSSHAGAASLNNGTVAIEVPPHDALATTPLTDQQVVDVVVGPNSTLSRSSLEQAGFPSGAVPIKVVECADLDGQVANLPKVPSDCDGSTLVAVPGVQANGSLFVKGFTIFALPDALKLGASNGTVCDDAVHQCVLGVFSDQTNFGKPHLFSAPFQIVSTSDNQTAPTGATSASGSAAGGTSGSAASSGSAPGGASAQVSVTAATLADTGGPTLWPWLLGAGLLLLVAGAVLRQVQRRTVAGRA